MSSALDHNELLPVISAINPAEVLTPNMSADVFVKEAENLYYWSIDDQQALMKVGPNWDLVLGLPARAGACRETQSLWVKEHNTPNLPRACFRLSRGVVGFVFATPNFHFSGFSK